MTVQRISNLISILKSNVLKNFVLSFSTMLGLGDSSGGLASLTQDTVTDEVIVPSREQKPISGITQAQNSSLTMPAARLEAEEVGLPDSAAVRVLCQRSEDNSVDSDIEYDSDGNLHPPFDRSEMEGPLNHDEEEVTPEENTGAESSKEQTLTPKIIDRMTASWIETSP